MNRKDDHLELALKFNKDEKISDFDNIEFVHQVFPQVDFDKVDISCEFAGFKFSQPFYINAMTGGSEKTKEFNRRLAVIARENKLFMASGSLSAALEDPSLEDSFRIIRKENPQGIVFANIGADKSLEDAKRAVDILEADGLQIHVNSCQELVMPEGDRNFESWLDNIDKMVNGLDLPVIVKEVGFGMSKDAVKSLVDIGVKTIDISGKGGTNFARIENFRRLKDKYDFLENFGNSTVNSLLDIGKYSDQVEILASGGIRNSMDIVKSLALGARSVGMAVRFLDMVDSMEVDDINREIENWKYQIRALMTLLSAERIGDLKKTDLILRNDVLEFAQARGIDPKHYANRK